MSISCKLIVNVLLALMLFVSVSSVAAAPASAMGNTQISGVGVFTSTAECPFESPNVYAPIKRIGGLVGCWYTDQVEVDLTTVSGAYQERGTETFIGCLSDGIMRRFQDNVYIHRQIRPGWLCIRSWGESSAASRFIRI